VAVGGRLRPDLLLLLLWVPAPHRPRHWHRLVSCVGSWYHYQEECAGVVEFVAAGGRDVREAPEVVEAVLGEMKIRTQSPPEDW